MYIVYIRVVNWHVMICALFKHKMADEEVVGPMPATDDGPPAKKKKGEYSKSKCSLW